MSAETRHLHRRSIAAATANYEADDDFQEHAGPRSLGSGGTRAREGRRRQSMQLQESTVVLDALSDETSELARYLLVGNKPDGWFASFFRRDSTLSGEGDDDDDGDMKSMGHACTDAYYLALEPIEIRREKIVQLSEAYAIFAGLFLGGTFVLYEWGSPRGFGVVHDNPDADRVFPCIMAILICCNISLALWASTLWITAILYGSRDNFVLEARKYLSFCFALQSFIALLTTNAIGWAVYSNLGYDAPEAIVIAVLSYLVNLTGLKRYNDLLYAVCPLAVYHMPIWYLAITHPFLLFSCKRSQKLKKRAIKDAQELESRVYSERAKPDPGTVNNNENTIGAILSSAAINLGRKDFDVSSIKARLEEDWFNEAGQLKGKSADFLSRYMPYRLAEEVHVLVELEDSG
jgi:hypothetical protein